VKPKKPDGETVTTTISFDVETYRKLKYLAADRLVTVRDVLREAVVEYLRRHKAMRR
jgi:hypothetical protein